MYKETLTSLGQLEAQNTNISGKEGMKMSSTPAYAFRPRTHFGKWHREAKLKHSTLVSLRSEDRYQGSELLKIFKFSGQDKGKEKDA